MHGGLVGEVLWDQVHGLHSVEAIGQVLVDLAWVVSVGEDVEKGLVRHEVEAWEHLFLLLEVVVKSLLASSDFALEFLEHILTAFEASTFGYLWLVSCVTHESLPVLVNLLESLGLIWKLSSNIFGLHENWVELLPVSLDLDPDLDDVVHGLESPDPVDDLILELLDILGALHGHKVHAVSVDELRDFVETSEERNALIVVLKDELLVLPNLQNTVKLLGDLVFLLGSIDELSDFLLESEEFELNEVCEAELG